MSSSDMSLSIYCLWQPVKHCAGANLPRPLYNLPKLSDSELNAKSSSFATEDDSLFIKTHHA